MDNRRGLQPTVQAFARSALGRLQNIRSEHLSEKELKADAIVFAPHPDDETLGCGGTIITKLAAGARIHIVFMTDGGGSHSGRIAKTTLAMLRNKEALAATHALGIEPSNVHFLLAPDGQLADQALETTDKVKAILCEIEPHQIFVPYAADRLPDHVATNQIVLAAIASLGMSPTILEFPVWFWNFWPHMRQSGVKPGNLKVEIRNTLIFTAQALRHFDRRVNIQQTLKQKLEALSCHETQMTRLDDNSEWGILADVADGDFLRCLTSRYEYFRKL